MRKKKLPLWGSLLLLALWLIFGLFTDAPPATEPTLPTETIVSQIQNTESLPPETTETIPETTAAPIDLNGTYTSKEDVALYIHTYGILPQNFMTKGEARGYGWSGGSLEPYAPGYCIGGDRFGNYEGLLPDAPGRYWTECDIDTLGGGSRGAKRIVFSNDGLIYYTDDHYASFELMYGDP